MVRNFAFKKFAESKTVIKPHTVLSKKFNDKLVVEEEKSEFGLGFVDKFVALFPLRRKLDTVRSVTGAKKWSSSYPHVQGNELYNRAVNIQNPFFEKLFLPLMDELMKGDKERGSMFLL